MKTIQLVRIVPQLFVLPLIGVLLAGCGGKKEESPPPVPAAEAQTQPQAVAAPAPAPVPVAPVDSAAAVTERLRQVEAAQRAREYEKAAEAMAQLQMRQRLLTEQQAALMQQRMQALQADLASAVASGDPRAKAAADRLRRAATVR
jgi:hypothetical protein